MIEKVFRKMHLTDKQSDFAYWQTKTPQERLAALEAIREEYHKDDPAYTNGMVKVFRIIKRDKKQTPE